MMSGNQSQWKTVSLLTFAVCEFCNEIKSALLSMTIHYYMTISAAQLDSLSGILYILKTTNFEKF